MISRGQILSVCLLLLVAAAPVDALPELPRVTVDTTPVPVAGRMIVVSAGGDFQTALNIAQMGDVIVLEAGATFRGPFTLPAKSGSGWITIETSTPSRLPARGTRVTPANASGMPKVITESSLPALRADAGAHHYRIRGIEFTAVATTTNYGIINFDGPPLAGVPHHLIIEQCYIHGHATLNVQRGVLVNSAYTAVIDTHISDIHWVGVDTQAIGGWNGPGPFKIVNNYLAAAGENIMFGGALPTIVNLVPSDIEIRRNYITKPLSWKADEPTYAGTPWTIKNLFELKNAQRVLIDGNIFEHNWPAAQSGFALLLTPRSELNADGVWAMPWTTVSNITISNNIFRGIAAGIGISGRDQADHGPTVPGTGFLIRNNLFYDIGTPRWGGWGALFMLVNGIDDLTIQHNTSMSDGSFVIADNAGFPPDVVNTGLVYTDNIHGAGPYGPVGPPPSPGGVVITHMFPAAVFTNNALIGPWPTRGGLDSSSIDIPYPGNFYPSSLADIGFVDPLVADFRLTDASVYKNAGTDGKDLGVDMDALSTALTDAPNVTQPVPGPNVTTLTASLSSITPGGLITATWSGIGASNPTDWLGLYTPGTPNSAYLSWAYVSCSEIPSGARAAGSCAMTIPQGLPAGAYELRLLAQDGYALLATSATFTVVSLNTLSLSESPTSVVAGASVTATWTGIVSATATDWIGLYPSDPANATYLAWSYVSCSQHPGAPRVSGSCSFSLPGGLVPGTYELRLFAENGYTRLATSAPFAVLASSGAVTLSQSSASLTAGASTTAMWSGIARPTPSDWIGLYASGAANSAYLAWIYVSCSQNPRVALSTGSCSFSLPNTLPAGTYELRLLAENGYTSLAISNRFTVTP